MRRLNGVVSLDPVILNEPYQRVFGFPTHTGLNARSVHLNLHRVIRQK